MYDITCVVSN